MAERRRSLAMGPRLDAAYEAILDAQILNDVAPYYDELEHGFAATHLPAVGTIQESIGFSSLVKLGWAIRDGEGVVGKAVCTVKRSGALKIGPIAVLPEHRRRGHASSLLRLAVERAKLDGRPCVFATVPVENTPARWLFERARFHRAGMLENHYRRDGSEDVVVYPISSAASTEASKDARLLEAGEWSSLERIRRYVAARFFPVDAAWERWLARAADTSLGKFEYKPHDLVEDGRGGAALVIYKRGGTAKVVPVTEADAPPSPALVRACEQAATQRQRRKVSLFLPGDVADIPGYERELVANGYSIRGPIAVWSRNLSLTDRIADRTLSARGTS